MKDMNLKVGDRVNVETICENVTSDNLEMIGPNVDELLDAINRLNGTQMSGKAFMYRDNVKLNPIDKTGHIISNDKFSIEVIPEGVNLSQPNTATYLREVNLFLKSLKFNCKLHKTK